MPDRLTGFPDGSRRTRVLSALGQAVVVVGLLSLAGVVAGLVWEWLWTPPSGVVVDQRWFLDEQGLPNDFSGTGSYVAVAAVAGLLVGAAVAFVFARSELVTLAAVLVGAALAGWVMYRVGILAGPPDPRGLASSLDDGTPLPARLRVAGASPFVAFPSGALTGLLVVYLGQARAERHVDRPDS